MLIHFINLQKLYQNYLSQHQALRFTFTEKKFQNQLVLSMAGKEIIIMLLSVIKWQKLKQADKILASDHWEWRNIPLIPNYRTRQRTLFKGDGHSEFLSHPRHKWSLMMILSRRQHCQASHGQTLNFLPRFLIISKCGRIWEEMINQNLPTTVSPLLWTENLVWIKLQPLHL